MPLDPCLIDFSNIDPSCAAFAKPGGSFPFLYAARLSDLTLTVGTDGGITGVTMKNAAKLKKFTSRKFQNSGSYPLKRSDNGRTTFTHTVVERIYHESQADRNTLVGHAQAEDLVFFLPTNARQVEVYGRGLGLTATTGTGGTGTKLDDDNTYLYTFTGDEATVPALVQIGVDFDSTITALNALVA